MAPEESVEASRLLQSFERRFLAARALRSFPWQSLEEKLRDSGSELLLDILQKTVKHPLCVKHPPSVTYARCFLSELIRKHEAAHEEPLDELYEALAEILTAEEPTQCHRSYLLPSGDSVTLSESSAIISHGTTGLVTWNAALYLAEWAIENPAAFTHRTVLELGSGAGLTGLAICKMCHPRAYIFSDCHSLVLEQLRGNILLNGLLLESDATAPAQHPGHSTRNTESPRVTVAQLDWDIVTAPQLAAFQPDVIIAAGKAGISWEAAPRHNQKLFPYEEHSEMEILKLMLRLNRKPAVAVKRKPNKQAHFTKYWLEMPAYKGSLPGLLTGCWKMSLGDASVPAQLCPPQRNEDGKRREDVLEGNVNMPKPHLGTALRHLGTLGPKQSQPSPLAWTEEQD
ncbi:protein-lysine N-methyltransferase EEF2KMT isoform X4 [Myotis daubentonii]|uniref:protein-lysine N-methyltransferase EEF2KMT isoform X4 n=1 Tax=Myotis daubentonii TaxID=98922 RepID=UPI002872BA4F|nr:protein-lysine N-methyltransferase EEF2KMT isoform X4 [Myotis daubentonii]